jgi:hypothetical protein
VTIPTETGLAFLPPLKNSFWFLLSMTIWKKIFGFAIALKEVRVSKLLPLS